MIKNVLSAYRPVPDASLPRFFGGAVGFMGYDIVRYFEDLPEREKAGLDTPDLFFMITDTLVIFDNITHMIKVVSNAHVKGKSAEAAYREATKKINALVRKLKTGPGVKGQESGVKAKDKGAHAYVEFHASAVRAGGAQGQGIYQGGGHLPGRAVPAL